MKTGTVFDIKEFAVFDGPGIRTTVFLKGCPLRCQWCHNPEGLLPMPQLMVSKAACTGCGACRRACTHVECIGCGACVPYCRQGLRKVVGVKWDAEALAQRLMKDKPLLTPSGGGVTFSGGEPLMQWDFVSEVIDHMPGMHTALETSGYCPDSVFSRAIAKMDLMLFDVKLMDPKEHLHYTGVENTLILRHLNMLCASHKPFIVRMPLIPGVNDGAAHFEAVAALLENAASLLCVEMLPYHQTAGAKYEMVGIPYRPEFSTVQVPCANLAPFEARGIRAVVL